MSCSLGKQKNTLVCMSDPTLLKRANSFDLGFLKKYITLQANEFLFVEDEGEFVEDSEEVFGVESIGKGC